MAIDMDMLVATLEKRLGEALKESLKETIREQFSEQRADISKEIQQLREEQGSANKALEDLSVWRSETTTSLEGTVSRIDDRTEGQVSCAEETVK